MLNEGLDELDDLLLLAAREFYSLPISAIKT
jgi:hypothetical protein